MDDKQGPGPENQSSLRTIARVLSVVLLLAGIVLVVRGISRFAADAQSLGVDGGWDPSLTIAAGGFFVVFGLAAAQVGWLRAGRQCSTHSDADSRSSDSCGQSLA